MTNRAVLKAAPWVDYNACNGCGPQDGTRFPNSFLMTVDFYGPCCQHDKDFSACWEVNRYGYGAWKQIAGQRLGDGLRNNCASISWDGDLYMACLSMANLYQIAVTSTPQSEDAYYKSLRASCICSPCGWQWDCSWDGIPGFNPPPGDPFTPPPTLNPCPGGC